MEHERRTITDHADSARLRTIALGGDATAPRSVHATRRGSSTAAAASAGPASSLLTVVVTASASPLNPSTAILRELILSLTHLQLPPQTPVLLSHDGPRLGPRAITYNISASYSWQQLSRIMPALAFSPAYLRYLSNVQQLLPAAAACTNLDLRLLVRATNGNLAGNLAFALSHVRTPYMLKVEHDHLFTRPVDALSVVRDMIADPRLKYVRFNRRENFRVRCDNGDYYRNSPPDREIAKALWGAHEAPRGVRVANNYTRTSCFSDMNHLASTAYYRNLILPVMLRADFGYPKIPPETLVQDHCWIARNHSTYGTYLFDAINAPPTIAHVDAALHGVGEILPQVREWIRGVRERAKSGAEDEPFTCRAPLDLRPPQGSTVSSTHWRNRPSNPPTPTAGPGAPSAYRRGPGVKGPDRFVERRAPAGASPRRP